MQSACFNSDDDDNDKRDGETERGDNEETFDALIDLKRYILIILLFR